MKLMINGRNLEGKRTGVGRYLANLLDIWSTEDNQNTYDVYFKNEIPTDTFLKNQNILIKVHLLCTQNKNNFKGCSFVKNN